MNGKMKLWMALVVCLLLSAPLYAMGDDHDDGTDANLFGHVVEKATGEHIPGVVVTLKGTSYGAVTDASGHYFLKNLPVGRHTVVIKGVGFLSQEHKVVLKKGKTVEMNFEIEEDVLNLDELVVSSNRQKTLRRLTPTLVSVIDDNLMRLTNAVCLAQSLTFQPGIRVEDNCQNCGFSQVRINGMEGRFSQILIDSQPIFSALAGVYGLEQMPTNMIDHVEVVRGGGSALYGANAIAGIVNIITKSPQTNSFSLTQNLTMTGMKKPDETLGFNGTIVGGDGRIGAMLFGQLRRRTPWDLNGDGFSEIGELHNYSLGTRVNFRPSSLNTISLEAHALSEERRGGDRFDLPVHVVSIAEAIRHKVYSGNLSYDHYSHSLASHLKLYLAGQVVDRKSYYGGIGDANVGHLGFIPKTEFGVNFGHAIGETYIAGLQYSYSFNKLLWDPAELLVGAEYMRDHLHDTMPIREWEPDATGKASLNPPTCQRINVLSQFGQLEWKTDDYSLLIGTRLDEHSLVRTKSGGIMPIVSPRATLRYNPTREINLRATYAQGFSAPQIFNEDLDVAIVGGEPQRVRNREGLKPEYSHSVSLSSDMYFDLMGAKTNILLEGFYTLLRGAFTNELVGEEKGYTMYERINGSNATLYGVNAEFKAAWHDFVLQSGLTWTHSRWATPQEWGTRSLLAGEDEKAPRDINTLEDNGPKTLDGFAKDYPDVSMTSTHMLRTPDLYGYLTATYTPIHHLELATTLNYTGRMYAPHVVEVGRGAAIIDRQLIEQGLRPKTADLETAPHWDRLEHTPHFFDLSAKVSYTFDLFSNTHLTLTGGVYNILQSMQKDFDLGGFRDSGYIVGPMMPRSVYMGLKLDI